MLRGFLLPTFSGYGGIGRRARFRFWWETVQVQVLLSAVKQKQHPAIPDVVFINDSHSYFFMLLKFSDEGFSHLA